MKKTILTAICAITTITAGAQSMNVNTGSITYSHKAANVGDATFSNGETLTIEGKTYTISDISNIVISDTEVDDNTVIVTYEDNSAAVTVAGNIAQYLTVAANGAHVSVIQSDDLQSKVNYVLSGSSKNGSFYTDGDYKIAMTIDNLTLASPDSAAINIQNGKHIDIALTGTSYLYDDSLSASKACMIIEGNPTFSGDSLEVAGYGKHGISVGEKMVSSAAVLAGVTEGSGDGIRVSEYLQIDGGLVMGASVYGHGINMKFRGETKGTKDQYENNGFIIVNDGKLIGYTYGEGAKAVKADSTINVISGSLFAYCFGSAYYDTDEAEISGTSAIKNGGDFNVTGGSVGALNTGAGGKGINVDGNINISGGTVETITTGALFTYGDDDSKAQGIKADGNITISGGSVYSLASQYSAKAFKTDNAFTITGGKVLGIGNKKSEPTSATQNYKTYKDQEVSLDESGTITFDGVSYSYGADLIKYYQDIEETFPTYSNSSAKVLVSSPDM